MDTVYDELLGPKRFLPWSKENAMWWMCFRTTNAGHWSKSDAQEFNKCTRKYLIYFDHALSDDAALFALRVMERDNHFKAAKVSKFARDGEKVMVFLAKDDTRKRKMADVCKEVGFVLWGCRDIGDMNPVEKMLSDKYDEYLHCLSMAFRKMDPQGNVRVENVRDTEEM